MQYLPELNILSASRTGRRTPSVPVTHPRCTSGSGSLLSSHGWAAHRDSEIQGNNNPSERLLGGPVAGRKNWLFAGSTGGAHAAATISSILATCELAGVAPFAYPRDVLNLPRESTPTGLKVLTPRARAA